MNASQLPLFPKVSRNVGASRAVAGLLNALDWGPRRPHSFVGRIWGFLLLFGVFYTQYFVSQTPQMDAVWLWLGAYALYDGILETARKFLSRYYDTLVFRFCRTFLNVVFITWLVSVSSHDRALFALLFLIPIFAAICYFPRRLLPLAMVTLSLLGLLLGGRVPMQGPPMAWRQIIATTVTLLAISHVLKLVFDRSQLISTNMLAVQTKLHETLKLDELLKTAIVAACELTGANRALIIVVDPIFKRYITHDDRNLRFRQGKSIYDVVHHCTVLATGEVFETSDSAIDLPNGTIYSATYTCNPRSIVAYPLTKDGTVFGVISLTQDRPHRFDRLAKRQITQFASLLANAVAAALEHRKSQLRMPKGQPKRDEISKALMTATTEAAVFDLLRRGAAVLVPHGDQHLHRLDGNRLTPVVTTAQTDKGVNREMTLLHEAIRIREPVCIGNVSAHPLCAREGVSPYRSLLVAPLATETKAFGTLALSSPSFRAFTLEQELDLASLAHQAGAALARIREAEELRLYAGVLRQVLDKVRGFDVTQPEDALCQDIATAARDMLGFEVVRLRLLDPITDDLVTVAMICDDPAPHIGHRVPRASLSPLFADQYANGRSFLIPPDAPAWQEVPASAFLQSPCVRGGQWHRDHALLTPIIDVGGWLGVLSLDDPTSGDLPNPHLVEAIGMFTSAAGWVIQKGRAHQHLLARHREAHALDEAARQELAACHNLSGLGELTCRRVLELLHARRCALFLDRDSRRVRIHSSGGDASAAANGGSPDGHGPVQSIPIHSADNTIIGEFVVEGASSSPASADVERRLDSLIRQIPTAVQAIARDEHLKFFERSGVQDDLHDLKGIFHGGIQCSVELALHWLNEGKLDKLREAIEMALRNGRTFHSELDAMVDAVNSRYLVIPDCQAALESVINDWKKRVGGLSIELLCPPGIVLSGPLHYSFRRIAYGAIANAIRHSGAIVSSDVKITVSVDHTDDQVVLTVADTGSGAETAFIEGIGIKQMKSHVAYLKQEYGRVDFSIDTGKKKGTTVRFSSGLTRIFQ